MKLVVIEGVHKQETVKKYLGSDYQVFATAGHVRDLPAKTLAVNVNDNFKPVYEIMPDKKDIVKALQEKAAKADQIYLATDPDREGEAISWHICNILGLNENDKVRITFNEITKDAITKSLKAPRAIDKNLVDAQQARRILDRLVGYKISPIICKKIQPKLSAGRVQSAVLKIIVDREKEIQNFKPEEYWTLQASLKKQNDKTVFVSALTKINNKKASIKSKQEMDNLISSLAQDFKVKSIKKSVSKSHPSAPYTTSSLQQEAIQKLGMTSKKVSDVAQQLYEGVSLGAEGKVALVTYIRTDSVRISPEAIKAAQKYILSHFGEKYLPKTANVYKTKQSAQDAHEAIRPISLDRTPESIKEHVPNDCYRLYKLIYNKFLACQMADATFNQVVVEVENNNALFKSTGRTPVFDGYLRVFKDDKTSKKKDEEKDLDSNDLIPSLTEGEIINLVKLDPQQKFTKAPARFNEGSLVKEMEDKGIGRPATYSQTIATISNRNYTVKEGKNIVPTELGFKVVEFLDKYFSDIVDVEFTASMEQKLDDIAEHGIVWQDVVSKFYKYLIKKLQTADTGAERFRVEPKETDEICEKCGAKMVIRTGKYGEFLACSNYPTCKNIKNISKVVAKCPLCGSDVKERKSKMGKTFYGCSNYPNCKFISWDIPVEQKCPKCGSFMVKKNYYGKLMIKCSKCDYKQIQKKEDNNAHN